MCLCDRGLGCGTGPGLEQISLGASFHPQLCLSPPVTRPATDQRCRQPPAPATVLRYPLSARRRVSSCYCVWAPAPNNLISLRLAAASPRQCFADTRASSMNLLFSRRRLRLTAPIRRHITPQRSLSPSANCPTRPPRQSSSYSSVRQGNFNSRSHVHI